MRIKLEKGKQTELILNAKGKLSWKELGKLLELNDQYLSRELKKEKRLLSDIIYECLCKLAKIDYNKFIKCKLEDNWGRSKGGMNSLGSTIKIPKVKLDENFAEIVGAILGDGHVSWHKKGKKLGVYGIRIAGDIRKDKSYHQDYLNPLFEKVFGIKPRVIKVEKMNARFLDLSSKEVVLLFGSMGIKPGNKIKNQTTIPKWVWNSKNTLRACLRGLIDTDGCIHRMSKRDSHLIRLNFVNHNKRLLEDTRKVFLELGFTPCKIINGRIFYISRQNEINKYLKEIGFSNNKHLERVNQFISPVV